MSAMSISNFGDEDDEIVKEIPICHSTRLQECLYSFRYPLIAKTCPNEQIIKQSFFKPKNEEILLEMSINVDSPCFDADRAELIAQEVDGAPETRKPNHEPHFEHDLVDKITLKSSKTVPNPSQYAALIYNGREVHLTTLKDILQFRPCFDYLDRGAKRKKDSEHNELSDEEPEPGPSGAQAVTVKFKQNDDRWKKARSESFQQLRAKSAGEAWLPCGFHTESSAFSKVEKLKLYSENLEDTGQGANLTDAEYLRVLIPEDQEQATIEPTLPSNIMSLHALRALPIDEQCRLLLKDAQIIQFQQLQMLLAGNEGVNPETLLKTLPKVAALVRGNWVVKSEVLYPEGSLSATSGVPAELMCRARNYVLYLFTKNQFVERKKVSSIMKIPSEEVKEIFTGFSRLSHNKGWELVLPLDHDFIVKHNDVVTKQAQQWEEKFKQLSEFFKENKRQRRKSKSVSEEVKMKNQVTSSDNDSGTEKNRSPIVARKNKHNSKSSHRELEL